MKKTQTAPPAAAVPPTRPGRAGNVLVYVYGGLLVLVGWLVFSYIFDKKVAITGDPTDYYLLGKALAQGDGYVSIVSPEKPPARHFPPGYPAVLAVLMSVFSEKIATLQAANGFFLIGAVLMLFDIFRRMGRNLHLAFVAALLVLVNVNILMFATQLMSETVYLFFSTLALWCFTRSDLNRRPWADGWFWAFVLMAVVSYYIRQTGLMLLAGVGLYLLFRRKWLHIGLMAAAFVVGVLPWSLRNARLGGDSHLRDMQMINPLQPGLGQVQGVGGWVSRFFTNTERYLTREVPSGVLSTFVEDYTRPIGGGEWLTGLLLVALMAFGWWRLRQYRLLLAGYAAATFALLLIYPEVWTGNRLMLHLVPFFIFCGLYGLYQLLKRGAERAGVQNATLLKVALPLAGLLLVPATRPELRQLHQYARIPGYDPAHQNYFQLAEFVKANARPGTMVACRKPSLFAVFSDSYATNYAYTENQQAFLDDFRKRKVNLVVIDGLGYASTPRYLVPVVLANPDKFPIIQQLQEPDTFLCGFDDRFGWHGPYNASGLPAGTGEYRFSDGRKLVGSFTDGRFNSLTGTAVLYDADGRPLGPTLWNNGQQTR